MTDPLRRRLSQPRPGTLACLPVALALLLCSGALPAAAQVFGGPIVPSGHLRLEVDPWFISWHERFGMRNEGGILVEEVEPLGWALTSPAFGDDRFAGPLDGQDILRTLLDDPDYRHSLGNTQHLLEAHVRRIPFRVDLGLTSWLTIGATVPIVQRRIAAEFIYDAGGANAGAALASGESAPFLSEYKLALAQTGLAVDTVCVNLGDTAAECVDGRAFLQDATGLLQSLDALYVSSTFMPLGDSDAATAVTQLVDDVRAEMATYGVDSFVAAPPFADPFDQAGFEAALIRPVHGASGLPLETVGSLWELGDVEVHGALRLLDTTRDWSRPPPPPGDSAASQTAPAGGGLGIRLGVAGLVRLATAMAQDSLRTFLDLDRAEGQMDMELRGFGDVLLGRRLGVRFDGRYGIASPATVVRRVAGPDDVLADDAPIAAVQWTPGDYVDVTVVPELFLTPQLGIGFLYRRFSRGADTFDGTISGVDASPLERETEVEYRSMGVEVRYSSLPARARGETGLPIEVRFRWETARDGSGGRTPKAGRVRMGVSLFRRLWGG